MTGKTRRHAYVQSKLDTSELNKIGLKIIC